MIVLACIAATLLAEFGYMIHGAMTPQWPSAAVTQTADKLDVTFGQYTLARKQFSNPMDAVLYAGIKNECARFPITDPRSTGAFCRLMLSETP